MAHSYTCCLHSSPISYFARLRYRFHKETSGISIQIHTKQHTPNNTRAYWHSGLYTSLVINMQHRNALPATGIQHNRSSFQPCKRQRFEGFIVILLGLHVAMRICGYRCVSSLCNHTKHVFTYLFILYSPTYEHRITTHKMHS